jgi:hypothetical protein
MWSLFVITEPKCYQKFPCIRYLNCNDFLYISPPLSYDKQKIVAYLVTKYQQQGQYGFSEVVQWHLCYDILVDPGSDSLNYQKKIKKCCLWMLDLVFSRIFRLISFIT